MEIGFEEDIILISERAEMEEHVKVKKGRFGQTPEWVQKLAFSKDISWGALGLYTYLDTFYGGFSKGIFPKQEKIAADMGSTPRTVRRWQSELVRADVMVVTRIKKTRGGNFYRIRWYPPSSSMRDVSKPRSS